jgi:hypothetical protein
MCCCGPLGGETVTPCCIDAIEAQLERRNEDSIAKRGYCFAHALAIRSLLGHAAWRKLSAMGPRRMLRALRILAVLVAVTLLSCLPLLLVEIGLRVASVGAPSELFLPAEGDPDYFLTNPNFAAVYFVPGLARTMKLQYIHRQKRPETYRIFVLGGSAAVGYPENRTGFSRKLEVLLRRTFPDLEIEVVNLGTAAINSYVVWDIAQHSIEYAPDLFLVYIGNNEVVGPFGPIQKTTIPIEDVDSIRALVSVKRLRLAQLVARWTSGGVSSRWQGMQAFMRDPIRQSDPRLQTV